MSEQTIQTDSVDLPDKSTDLTPTRAQWADVAHIFLPSRWSPTARLADERRRTRATIYLGIAIVVFTGYFLVRVTSQAIDEPVGDWGVYYRAGLAMLIGQTPYSLEFGPYLTFKNAPIVATAIAPLAMLPPVVARWLWCVMDVALVGLIAWLAVRIVAGDGPIRYRTWWVAVAAVGLSLRYIMNQMHAGSTATLWVAFLMGAFFLIQKQRMFTGGGVLAAAVAWKLVPICFVPYLFLRPKTIWGLAGFVTAVAVMFITPAIALGWNQNLTVHAEWPQHLFSTEIPHQIWRVQNQSVYAQLSRLLAPSKHGCQFLDIPRDQVRNLWLILSCLSAAALYGSFWLADRRATRKSPPAIHLALLLIYMTVFNPLAWRYNFVAMLFPYFLVLYGIVEGGPHRRTRVGLLVVAWVLSSLPSGGPWPIESLHAAGDRLWGTILLGIAVVLTAPVLSKGTESAHSESESTSWETETSTPLSAMGSPRVHSVA